MAARTSALAVRASLVLAVVLLAGTLASWEAVGASLSFYYPYPHTIPTFGWYLSLAAFVGILYCGGNILRLARGRAS